MFFVALEFDFFSDVDQNLGHLGNRPLPKDLPLLGGDGNHHAPRGISDLMGYVVSDRKLHVERPSCTVFPRFSETIRS